LNAIVAAMILPLDDHHGDGGDDNNNEEERPFRMFGQRT
jgi:hypothetical protein